MCVWVGGIVALRHFETAAQMSTSDVLIRERERESTLRERESTYPMIAIETVGFSLGRARK